MIFYRIQWEKFEICNFMSPAGDRSHMCCPGNYKNMPLIEAILKIRSRKVFSTYFFLMQQKTSNYTPINNKENCPNVKI